MPIHETMVCELVAVTGSLECNKSVIPRCKLTEQWCVCIALRRRTILTKGTIALTVGSLFPGVLTRHLCTKPMVIASIQEQQKVH